MRTRLLLRQRHCVSMGAILVAGLAGVAVAPLRCRSHCESRSIRRSPCCPSRARPPPRPALQEFVLRFARWCYTALFCLLLPVIVARLWWRARRAPAYRQRIAERFGIFSQSIPADGIWVHAVSVGETIAAAPLIRALQLRHPHCVITVTTMTPTGSERVRALFGDSVAHVYAPYDLPLFIDRKSVV